MSALKIKPGKEQWIGLSFGLLLVLLMLLPHPAHAAAYLDPLAIHFKAATKLWQPIIYGYAVSLFWKLVLIDLTWTTIVWVKDRKEVGELLSGYTGKIFSYGFFWLLLSNAGHPDACSVSQVLNCSWIATITESFSQIGKEAATSAGADVGTLDSILFNGFNLAGNMISVLSDRNVFERIYLIFPTAFACFCAAIGFALIAAQLLVTMIESYIAIYGGIILLGFGGSRWTTDMASSYLKFAIGTGVKLMLCYLVIGLGFNMFTGLIPVNGALDSAESLKSYIFYIFHVAAFVLIYVYIVFTIPGIASAMMSGSPNASMGGMAAAAITAAASMTGAGAVAGKMAGLTSGAGGSSSAAKALADTAKSLPGGGGGPGAAANAMNGGGGGNGVQPPGSGLGTTPSGGTSGSTKHPGGVAGDLAASDNSSGAGAVSEPGGSSDPSMISTDTNIGAAKAAASNVTATPTRQAGGNTAADSPSPVASATTSSGSGQGDASGASAGAADPHTALLTAISKNMDKMANGPEQVQTLAEKVTSMNKFVPHDSAGVSTPGISMGHTKD